MKKEHRQQLIAQYKSDPESMRKLRPVLGVYGIFPESVYSIRIFNFRSHARWRKNGGLDAWEKCIGSIGIVGTQLIGWQLAGLIYLSSMIEGFSDGEKCRPYPFLWSRDRE